MEFFPCKYLCIWRVRFVLIQSLDPLTEPVNQLLIAPTLAAFEEKVLAYLPKELEQK